MQHILKQHWPFLYLSPRAIAEFESSLIPKCAQKDSLLLEAGKKTRHAVFLISGGAHLFITKDDGLRFYSEAKQGALLGEASALLNVPTKVSVITTEETQYIEISADNLRALCQRNPNFAQSIANNIRERQGLFSALDRFTIQLESATVSGVIRLDKILPAYQDIQPALHPKSNSEEMDLGAWGYAINRLPQDCTTTFVYLLSAGLPELLQHMKSQPVETIARRRQAWSIAPGKTLIALRDAKTDLADFVTCLCVHAVESRKLRRRFRSAEQINHMFNTIDVENPDPEFIDSLPLTQKEWVGFSALWRRSPLVHLRNIIIHHEDFLLYVENELTAYDSYAAEQWTQTLRHSLDNIDAQWREKPIHIISSNTYGVKRCLSDAIHQREAQILKWGLQFHPEIQAEHFSKPKDLLYALVDLYLKAHPEDAIQIEKEDIHQGIHTVPSQSFTGITLNIIQTKQLSQMSLDDGLIVSDKDILIINIDYAFAKQAEDIMSCLCLLFSNQIHSINVMGKAGALCGERGDILLARQIVMEREDDCYLINSNKVDPLALAKDSGRNVHDGTVLTVYGTLLQNRALLEYYRNFWKCVGLEMEGSFYARQIQKAQHHGIVSKNTDLRFIYYVSDLPLAKGEQLSKEMDIWEFISPLYGITRTFLNAIFKD